MVWITGIISPCLNINLPNSIYPFQKMLYSNVCHQDVNKSFACNGIPFLVCARCTGIYFGALMSAVVILISNFKLRFKTKYLYLLSIPILLDVLFYSIGIYPYNKFIASSTGFLFGSSIFLYILSALEYLLFINQKNNNDL
jgi:uncharacterized membrane protein